MSGKFFTFMDLDDLFKNFDWDPAYLAIIFNDDFDDMTELDNANIDIRGFAT